MAVRLLKRAPVAAQLMAINIVMTLCTFATGVMLARSLGPVGRGAYATLFTWAGTVANACVWGTHIHLARIAAQEAASARAVYRAAYRVALVSGVAGTFAYVVAGLIAAKGNAAFPWPLIVMASFIILFSVPNALQIQIELGRTRYGSYNVVRALFVLANFSTIGILWASGVRSMPTFLAALVLTTLAASVGAMAWIRGSIRDLPRGDASPLGALYRQALPIGFSLLLTGLGQQADKMLVSLLFPPAIMGIYIVAALVSQVQNTVGEALSQLFFSRAASISDVRNVDTVWLGRRLRQTILIYIGVCASAALVVPPIVPLVYGRDFAGSSALLFVLLPALAFQGMSRPFEETLRGLDRPRVLMVQVVAVMAVLGLAASFAGTQRSILMFATGTAAAYLTGLFVAAAALARIVDTPLATFLLPRPSDLRDLMHSLAALRHRDG